MSENTWLVPWKVHNLQQLQAHMYLNVCYSLNGTALAYLGFVFELCKTRDF